LQYARDRGRDAGQALTACLHQNIRHAVAVAIPRGAAGQNKQIGLTIEVEHLILRKGTEPGDAVAYREGSCAPPQRCELTAAPDMNEAPMKSPTQGRESPEQDVEALLRYRAGDREDLQRALRVRSGARRPLVGELRESVDIQPVIAQMNPVRPRRQRS